MKNMIYKRLIFLVIYIVRHDLWAMQGAGKTSLLKAILSQSRVNTNANVENKLPESDDQGGIARGLCYCVSAGVNLQVFILFIYFTVKDVTCLYSIFILLYYTLTLAPYFIGLGFRDSHLVNLPLFVDSLLSCIQFMFSFVFFGCFMLFA